TASETMADATVSNVWMRAGEIVVGALSSIFGVRKYLDARTTGERESFRRLEADVRFLKRRFSEQEAALNEHRAASGEVHDEQRLTAQQHAGRLRNLELGAQEERRRITEALDRFSDALARIERKLEPHGT